MKKFLTLAMVGAFALGAYAAEDKKPEPKPNTCGMACCKENKAANCKECKTCQAKKAEPKAEPKKS